MDRGGASKLIELIDPNNCPTLSEGPPQGPDSFQSTTTESKSLGWTVVGHILTLNLEVYIGVSQRELGNEGGYFVGLLRMSHFGNAFLSSSICALVRSGLSESVTA